MIAFRLMLFLLRRGALISAVFLLLINPAARAEPIRSLDWTGVPAGQAPAAGASWTRLALPARWSTSDGPLQGAVLRMQFEVGQPADEQRAILLTYLPAGGRVALNGHLLRAIPHADAAQRVNWQRPFLLPVADLLLQPGFNTLTIETVYAAGTQSIGSVAFGPLPALMAAYDLRFFFAYTALWIGVALALPIFLFFGLLLLRRRDRLLALLALAAVFWLGYVGSGLLEQRPAALQPWIRILTEVFFGGFMTTVMLAVLQQSEHGRPRLIVLACIYAAAGPLLAPLLPAGAAAGLMATWRLGLAGLLGGAALLGIGRSLRGLPAPHPMLLAASLVLVLALIHDMLPEQAIAAAIDLPLLNLAGPLVLATLATPLVDRFFRALTEAESARAELESRVREREQLLKRNFERLRESERTQARVAERQRIMQDIHDGLGSQLLSALMLVERRALTNRQVAQVLRESIDDLRLAIDAIASDESSLTSALGNLRYRMEPRLRAAGIKLSWSLRGLPAEIDVDPATVLPLLRIVQEALTNALKHSRATAVRVELSIDSADGQDWLNLSIADNGRGIGDEGVRGRGLLNMRNRAARMGAQFTLDSAPGGGTLVQVRIQLGGRPHEGSGEPTIPLNTRSVIEHMRQL